MPRLRSRRSHQSRKHYPVCWQEFGRHRRWIHSRWNRTIRIFIRLSFGDLDIAGLRFHGRLGLDFAVGLRLAGTVIRLFFFGAAVRCWGLDLLLDLIFLANLLRRVFALLFAGLSRATEG